MDLAKQTILVATVLLGLALPAAARTWRVVRDGSGDFATIQPAVNQAAKRDTILIGPGEYREYGQYTSPDGTWKINTCVGVGVDSLTILGTNRDLVRIGPPAAPPSPQQPEGISVAPGLTQIQVQNLTVENAWDGVYLKCGASVRGCTFRKNRTGILYTSAMGISVFGCLLYNNSEGFISYQSAANIAITNCDAQSGTTGFYIGEASNVQLSSCSARDCLDGFSVHYSSGVMIYNCTTTRCSSGIGVGSFSDVELIANNFFGSLWALYGDVGTIQADGNVFRGAGQRTILMSYTLGQFRGNHILKASRYAVEFQVYTSTPHARVDMRGNYWGTASADSIASWIWDGNDDPTIYGVVDFQPFSAVALPTEKKSMGGVKGLYR